MSTALDFPDRCLNWTQFVSWQVISWLSLQNTSAAMLDIALAGQLDSGSTLHLIHPRPVPWKSLAEAIRDTVLESGVVANLDVIPFSSWMAKLEACDAREIHHVPALKLIPFLKGLATEDVRLRNQVNGTTDNNQIGVDKEAFGVPVLSIDKMLVNAPSLRDAKPLKAEDAASWVRFWLKHSPP